MLDDIDQEREIDTDMHLWSHGLQRSTGRENTLATWLGGVRKRTIRVALRDMDHTMRSRDVEPLKGVPDYQGCGS
jgi:hypothetical protein